MSDISDAPQTVSIEVQQGRKGLEGIVRQEYTPPLDGSDDLVKGFDLHLAKGVFELLSKHYFGYDWKTLADSRQGIIAFQIPDLMGPTLHMVIRLAEYSDLTPELVINKGGELLERMHLPRTQAEMADVLFARQHKHLFDFGDVKQ